MAILKVITEPNEILRKRSKEVTDFSARLCELLDDMAETMNVYGGVGIAAVQVGVLWRACLVDTDDGICELINPVILASKKPKHSDEGCLSVPNEHRSILRPQEVTVKAQGRSGKCFERMFFGREAVCACHEIDHLDGILFIDKREA